MRILIADDEPKMGLLLASRLEDDGHFVRPVTSGKEALNELPNGYELLITDLRMLDMDGIELTKKAKKRFNNLPVILMTAYAGVDTAVSAMKAGAEDYIVKPFALDEMAALVKRIDESRRLKEELDYRRTSDSSINFVVGKSAIMRSVMEEVKKVSITDTSVLILGATGTGKELIAKMIHSSSSRGGGPFIPINCASLSEQLLESELFGHEKGSFTGAYKAKPGKFELADRGTLFLDELGELPLSIQAKLLRALEEKVIYRLGGVNPIKVDIRLVAATNRDIETEIMEGNFREDLYYRIAVFPIRLPTLEERKEDIYELVAHFLSSISYTAGISREALERLEKSCWRGNIRELFNVLERAAILAAGENIKIAHLPSNEHGFGKKSKGHKTLEEMEREALIDALRKSNGNKTSAAKILGITRRMVYSRMNKLGISEDYIKK
ncbi:sigma-54-dependent Fis family transcriptional regulator [bacterium]|nr:sigma-54-dependent Fis family transcriptional regulator [bacterium]